MSQQAPGPGAPADPIAAATHADPYDHYARLAAGRPFAPDTSLGVRVAAGAAAVAEVLAHPACRVRPAGEPVPAALLGSPAGEIFRHLVRMSDGAAHASRKHAVSAALGSLAPDRVAAVAERWAERLAGEMGPASDAAELAWFAFALPIHVIGGLLGLADDALPLVVGDVGELVRCIFPGGTPEQTERGKGAAGRLRKRFRAELARAGAEDGDFLLGRLAAGMRPLGPEAGDAAVANAIGLLVQAYDATAGLIGNTLLALSRDAGLRERVAGSPVRLAAVVDEVLRHDPPIQNTRRFVAEPATVAGERVEAGEVVLVLLAAANRDPDLNPDPDAFDPERRGARDFSFGAGAHVCPGRLVATAIARAAVARLLANGIDPARLDPHPAYRPSANARIPILAWRRASHTDAGRPGDEADAVAQPGSRR